MQEIDYNKKYKNVLKDFENHIQNFSYSLKKDFSIEFKEGNCSIGSIEHRGRKIVIDPSLLQSEEELEFILLHEFGHFYAKEINNFKFNYSLKEYLSSYNFKEDIFLILLHIISYLCLVFICFYLIILIGI